MKYSQLALRALASVALVASAASAQTSAPAPVDTLYQTYDEGPVTLPLGIGFRIPSYNRVDGVAVPWGPSISLGGGRVQVDPIVTYRSNLGAFDPSVKADVKLGTSSSLDIAGGRGTFTNDGWIRSDLINSLAAIGVGSDARNYFRADRGTVVLKREIISGPVTYTPRIGALHEYAWSTGIHERHDEAPWSIFGRTDTLKMRRVNPPIWKGHTTSGTGGLAVKYDLNDVVASVDAGIEHAFDSPVNVASSDGRFTQLTMGSKAEFPTFGTQSFAFRGRGVFGFGDDVPPQRWVYLGGAGTLATVDLLALGGDRLLYVEGEYSYPLVRPLLPFVGAPVLSLRYAAGSAGVNELPDFIQNIGVGIGVKLVKAEYHIDPSYRKTSYTKRSAFSIGFSLSL